MRLLLLFSFFYGTCWTSDNYCIYQTRSFSVKEGDTVTIPCTYTYPERLREKSQIVIRWWEQDGIDCSNIKKHITDNSGNIIDEYKERISIINHPDNNRTQSLRIRGVKASDKFCCRASVITNGRESSTLCSQHGTSLTFTDEKRSFQVEELIAVPGEEMTIPCHYPLKTLGEALEVTWNIGKNDLCVFNIQEIYPQDSTHTKTTSRYSVVDFPVNISLRIHSVQRNVQSHFCCRVTPSNGEIQHSRFGTELTIAGTPFSSPFNVTQPDSITGHRGKSVILNCSYSSYMKSNVLGVNIYWRVGNISGPYVYHPYREMVNPSYRGRTEIRGEANLHLRELQTSDDSMYYCFVMIRLCTGNNQYQKLIQYGEGTRLTVTDPLIELVTIISISAAVLLVLLCLILVILKTTGVICKKKKLPDKLKTPDNPEEEEIPLEERPYCEILTKNTGHDQAAKCNQEEKEKMAERAKDEQENENILYSELNKSKLQQRNPESHRKQEEQTVYAAVNLPESRK